MMTKLIEIEKNRAKQMGFTLIEIMISLVITSILIAGIFSVFLKTKQTQNYTMAMSRVQQAARFSLDYLKQDIRMIGYRGCISFDDPIVQLNVKEMPVDYTAKSNELLGFELAASPFNGTLFDVADIKNKVKIGTDAFAIARMGNRRTPVKVRMNLSSSSIDVDGAPGFKLGDVVFISDCVNADIFKVTNTPAVSATNITSLEHAAGSGKNTADTLSRTYFPDAHVSQYQSVLYFVGDSGRDNASGDNIYSLFQASNNFDGASPTFKIDEIIEGVENMQILYGEILVGGNFQYSRAAAVGDMSKVVSLKIALLVSSQQNVRNTLDDETYKMPGQDVAPGIGSLKHLKDRRLRYLVSSTVKIRNRQ